MITRTLSPKARKEIIREIDRRVRKNYVNLGGIDLDEWVRELESAAAGLSTSSVEDFENGVRARLKYLKSSHTAFYHGFNSRFLPQHTINATLKSIGSNGSERWMFLDVFPEGPADKAGIRPGQTLLAIDGIPSRPPELPELPTGKKYRLLLSENGSGSSREVSLEVPFRKGTRQRPPILEPKPVSQSVLHDRIALLRVPYFSGSAGMGFGVALAAAIADLNRQHVDRLIIDLRGNIGAAWASSMLASYLCSDKRPIGYSLTPQRVRKGYDKEKLPRVPMPRSKPELMLTLATFAFRDKSVVLLTQGLGRQTFHGRIVVLINEWTNSAGEMVASFAKENGLATMVGVKTAGNVLGAANFKLAEDLLVAAPYFWLDDMAGSMP